MVQEWVIYDAQNGTTLIDEPKRDADKGKPMDKIGRSICVKFSAIKDRKKKKASPTAPIGSTQNVGSSVKGGRWPEENDSSPMLLFQIA